VRYFIARHCRCRESVLWLLGRLLGLWLLGHHASEHHGHIHHLLIIGGLGLSTTHSLLLLALHNVELHQLLMVLLNCLLLHDDHLLVVQVLLFESHRVSALSGLSLRLHHWHHRHHAGHHTGHLGHSSSLGSHGGHGCWNGLGLLLFFLGSCLSMVLLLGFGFRLRLGNRFLILFDDGGNDLLSSGLWVMLFSNLLLDNRLGLGLSDLNLGSGRSLFSVDLLYFGLVNDAASLLLLVGFTLLLVLGFLGLLRGIGVVVNLGGGGLFFGGCLGGRKGWDFL